MPRNRRRSLDLHQLEDRVTPANAGFLDPGYATNGRLTLGTSAAEGWQTAAPLSSGSVFVAGVIDPGTNTDVVVHKLTPTGQIDSTFGSGAVTINTTLDSASADDRVAAILPLADGGALVVGAATARPPQFTGNGRTVLSITRLTATGGFDPSFGTAGRLVIEPPNGYTNFTGRSVAPGPNNTFLIAGEVDQGPAQHVDFAVLRVTAAGVVDTTYGTSGMTIVTMTNMSNPTDQLAGIASRADGSVVLGARVTTPVGSKPGAARLTPTGALDGDFGNSGLMVLLDAPTIATDVGQTVAMALPSDGRLLLLTPVTDAVSPSAGADLLVTRFTTAGQRDTTFGTAGTTRVTFGGSELSTEQVGAIAVQADGRIVLAGSTDRDGGTTMPRSIALARLTATGSPDPTFGRGGRVVMPVPLGGANTSSVAAVVLTSNARIIVVGSAATTSNQTDYLALGLTAISTGPLYPAIVGRNATTGTWTVLNSNGTAFAVTNWSTWNPNAGWQDTVTADFNGDGKTDIAARTAAGEWWVGLSNGSQFITTRWAQWNPAAGWRDVQVADFDGDGRADIAARTAGGEWWIGLSNGSGLATSRWAIWNEAAGWKDVRTADFNGDGKIDIAARTNFGEWWIGLSTGTSFPTTLWARWNEAAGWKDVRVGDFNGDGKTDIAARTNFGEWWISLSTGSVFQTSLWARWNEAAGWRDVLAADFDGDGKTDIAARTAGGEWWISRSAGSSFQTSLGARWNEAAGWADVMAGDFDRDGKADIVGRTGVQWWVGRSNGASLQTSLFGSWPTNAVYVDVRSGDFI